MTCPANSTSSVAYRRRAVCTGLHHRISSCTACGDHLGLGEPVAVLVTYPDQGADQIGSEIGSEQGDETFDLVHHRLDSGTDLLDRHRRECPAPFLPIRTVKKQTRSDTSTFATASPTRRAQPLSFSYFKPSGRHA
jgi:hypothetical protein